MFHAIPSSTSPTVTREVLRFRLPYCFTACLGLLASASAAPLELRSPWRRHSGPARQESAKPAHHLETPTPRAIAIISSQPGRGDATSTSCQVSAASAQYLATVVYGSPPSSPAPATSSPASPHLRPSLLAYPFELRCSDGTSSHMRASPRRRDAYEWPEVESEREGPPTPFDARSPQLLSPAARPAPSP